MFAPTTYAARRHALAQQVGSGLILLLGNTDSPMNYADNIYPFRQDSSFLYCFGLDLPGLAGLIDIDADRVTLFGNDGDLDSIVWTGPLASLAEQAQAVAVSYTQPLAQLEAVLAQARTAGRAIHYLPPYRAEQRLWLSELLAQPVAALDAGVSEPLTEAMIALRSIKSAEEIAQMENALEVAARMHTLALRASKPGVREQEVVGLMSGLAQSQGRQLAYPIIFSRDGHVLHNHGHGYTLQAGDLVVNDAGAESPLHYASDITRTIPVGGRFDERQRVVYQAVLDAQLAAIAAMQPGISYREVHDHAARVLVAGVAPLALFKASAEEVVHSGAYALLFPHGLGHHIGLDVHDMEALGENRVGYGEGVVRSNDFGRRSLRLGKPLRAGNVVTVEPGAYFIPALIERWEAEDKFRGLINYASFKACQGFGGIRIEDDVLVTAEGARVLGTPIAKTVTEVEALGA
jgi:Xaa-Pro aminopeptidase